MQECLFRMPADRSCLARRLARRTVLFDRSLMADVSALFDQVAREGDAAVLAATRKHDGVALDGLRLTDAEAAACAASLPEDLRRAVAVAIANIEAVNRVLRPLSWQREIRPGTLVGEQVAPLDSVGLWIPARKGPLISTALMLTVAARVAGVKRIAVGAPPTPGGSIDAGTVAAAAMAGANEFYVGNGVGLIAAWSVGTPSVPQVDGIFGPGPGAIAAAMAAAFSYGRRTVMGIGPSDSMVVADDSARPDLLACDLANEAEHGTDSASVLVTTCEGVATSVAARLAAMIAEAPQGRKGVLQHVFGPAGMGAVVLAGDDREVWDLVNAFAPEHLMLACRREGIEEGLREVRNAGEILLGDTTPFSAANYALGITAVLPTNACARAFSGITCRDMMKCSTIGSLDRSALAALTPTIEAIGRYEGLPFHVRAAQER
ncbi:MAG: histidinol dehydrogenase [Planctomycetes bacterium]|nr:histidinol dehydrogenase [Planctomycetota bacterium]